MHTFLFFNAIYFWYYNLIYLMKWNSHYTKQDIWNQSIWTRNSFMYIIHESWSDECLKCLYCAYCLLYRSLILEHFIEQNNLCKQKYEWCDGLNVTPIFGVHCYCLTFSWTHNFKLYIDALKLLKGEGGTCDETSRYWFYQGFKVYCIL